MKNNIVLALTKGRILRESLPLLADAGVEPTEPIDATRKLLLATNHGDIKLAILRGADVPTYVKYGAADLGIVGKDVLLEYGSEGLYEAADLGIACCRLMTAGIPNRVPNVGTLRVATKFVNITRDYFGKKGKQIDIVKLYGALELAPLMDLADVIVDLVDTGDTLRANGLIPFEEILPISSRLIVNKASIRQKTPFLSPLIDLLAKLN
ncbi:MAG: ATP phosphoribosyltransferase [Halieaceae bacterium]|nr:ATP phosphoribosyltransferase [Halieaceae bacterium]